jgi:hypothetical protein
LAYRPTSSRNRATTRRPNTGAGPGAPAHRTHRSVGYARTADGRANTSTVVDPPRTMASFAPICRELIDQRLWHTTLGHITKTIAKPGNYATSAAPTPGADPGGQLTNRADQSGMPRQHFNGGRSTHTKANFAAICPDLIDQRLWQLHTQSTPGIHYGRVPHTPQSWRSARSPGSYATSAGCHNRITARRPVVDQPRSTGHPRSTHNSPGLISGR